MPEPGLELGRPRQLLPKEQPSSPVGPRAPEIFFALYGDPTVSFLVNEEGPVTEPSIGAGRGGRLARDHAYISAVATLHRRSNAEDWWQQWREEYWATRPEEERSPEDFAAAARITVELLAATGRPRRRPTFPVATTSLSG